MPGAIQSLPDLLCTPDPITPITPLLTAEANGIWLKERKHRKAVPKGKTRVVQILGEALPSGRELSPDTSFLAPEFQLPTWSCKRQAAWMAWQVPLNSPGTRSTPVLLSKASARLLWTTGTIVGCLQRAPEGLENGNSQRWSGGELRNTLLLLLACLLPHHTTPVGEKHIPAFFHFWQHKRTNSTKGQFTEVPLTRRVPFPS